MAMVKWLDENIVEKHGGGGYLYGLEVAPTTKKLHMQGYWETKSDVRMNSFFNELPNTNLECARGTKEQNYMYCSKDGKFKVKNLEFNLTNRQLDYLALKEEYGNMIHRPWQQELHDIMMATYVPKDREVFWIYDKNGCSGKTEFQKYMITIHNAMQLTGADRHMKKGALNWLEANPDEIMSHVFINLSMDEMARDCSYRTIESFKDGVWFSAMFECGKWIQHKRPKVCVMANCMPNMDGLERKRWSVGIPTETGIDWVIKRGVEASTDAVSPTGGQSSFADSSLDF